MEKKGLYHYDCGEDDYVLVRVAKLKPGDKDKVYFICDPNQIDHFQCKFCGWMMTTSTLSKHKWHECPDPWNKQCAGGVSAESGTVQVVNIYGNKGDEGKA